MTTSILLEDVFKTNGIPTHTFVEPIRYTELLVSLRTPGRSIVIEGPSGIGKTTAIKKALDAFGYNKATILSARRPEDVEYISIIPEMNKLGTVIIDDFHKLSDDIKSRLADYIKYMADKEELETKIIILGINLAGKNLISFAKDLVSRIDIIRFESNPSSKVEELIDKGCNALNINISVKDEIVLESRGSFFLAQMLCRETCLKSGVISYQEPKKIIKESFESIKSDVWERLSRAFGPTCDQFCRGSRMRPEGRAPYLHLLRWLADCNNWTLSIRDAIQNNPGMRVSITQVVKKQYLFELINTNEDISKVIHYESDQITVEDPQFLFYIRNISWKKYASDLGFVNVSMDNNYDFALSFAGEVRNIARMIFERLVDNQVEVFYDNNEQSKILSADIESYLKPIYESDSRFVIVLLSEDYPNRIWTRFESDVFKKRFNNQGVIPIWFDNVPQGVFDISRKYGGYTIKSGEQLEPQIDELTDLLLRKLGE